MTANRMISGLVLKYLNGSRFVIPGRYPSPLPCRKPGSSDTADQHVAAVGNPVVEIGQSRLLAIPGGGGLPRIVQGDVIVGDVQLHRHDTRLGQARPPGVVPGR